MKTLLCSSLIGISALFSPLAAAECPTDESVVAYTAEFSAKRLSKGFGKNLSMADATCARAKLVRLLPSVHGNLVGYKAVFTNPESQRRFGIDGPAWGAMFGGMMLENGARVAAGFGAKPRYEADFIVVVKDAGLADAGTPLEALEHISDLVPFIELPDLMLDGTFSGVELIATNAAFRGGVIGPRIKVEPSQASALLDMLATMEVVVTEARSGREIGKAKGDVLMGNPIHAALWLAKALKQDGIALKPGDMLSLGGFLASTPVQPGTTMVVRYHGLPGTPAVTVHFD